MPATDSLLLRKHLLEDMGTPTFRRYMEGYADSLTGRTRDRLAPDRSVDPATTGASMLATLSRETRLAHSFYVTPQMQAVVTAAAESLPEDAEPCAEDFPTAQGWLYVPGGISQLDVRGRMCTTVYVLWSVYGGAAHLTYLSDKTHPLDSLSMSVDTTSLRKAPRITPWANSDLRFGHPLPKGFSLGVVLPPEDANAIRVIPGPDGQTAITVPKGFTAEELKPGMRVEPVGRWLLACLRLMQQP